MNLKRGLTRLFIVLWIAWGVGLGAFFVGATRDEWRAYRDARNTVTFGDGTKIHFGGTPTKRDIEEAYEHVRGASLDSTMSYEIELPRELANTARRHMLEALGIMLGLGGLVPGAVLVAIRWVWAGFDHRA